MQRRDDLRSLPHCGRDALHRTRAHVADGEHAGPAGLEGPALGADPYTDWLSGCDIALDDKGFVRTGPDVGVGRRPLETSRPGVFAIGDVRSGSVKRVAAAVGEGAQIVATLHAFLAEAGRAPAVAKP